MAGTLNREAYLKLKLGRKYMTYPVTEESLQKAGECFKEAIELDSGMAFNEARDGQEGYPKAWGHLGYSVLTGWIEGWEVDREKVMADAGEFTGIATGHVRGVLDYDTHWDRAFYLQMMGALDPTYFDQAIDEYELAMELNHVDTNLLLEASEGYVSAGRYDDALALLNKAGRSVSHDWYRWDRAWVYFFKAKQDPAFYDLAISEIRNMYWNPGEPQYMFDVQLLIAAIYANKGDTAKAETALKLFQQAKPNWNLSDEARARPLKLDEDKKHLLNGCGSAGLADPDGILDKLK